eukprot:m.38680 g.38680  ORF g.38680 m.38680 type:complete len:197 (-) comp7871_c0_seq1:89-679(-)
MPSLELSYWDIPGRAEAIRVAFRSAKIEFTDTRIKNEQWPALKQELGCAVPVLKIDGKILSQSCALARYAGRLSGLYPEDALAALQCDEIMDISQDILTSCPQPKDAEEKKKAREEYAAGKMKMFFEFLAKRLAENGGDFLCGAKLTIADLVFSFSVLALLRMEFFDHVAANYVESFPTLHAYEGKVKAWVDENTK